MMEDLLVNLAVLIFGLTVGCMGGLIWMGVDAPLPMADRDIINARVASLRSEFDALVERDPMEMSGVQAVEGMMAAIPGVHRNCDRMAWMIQTEDGYEAIEPGDWVFTDSLGGRHLRKPDGMRRREFAA